MKLSGSVDCTAMWTDRQITEAFVLMYGKATSIPYCVTSWQDDEGSNQNVESVDGLAEAPEAPALAIEVTKVESFPVQRLDDGQTEALAEAITPELTTLFPNGVSVYAEFGAWKKGFDWAATRGKIKQYLRDLPGRLTPGTTRHDISGVPFPLWVVFQPELRLPLLVGRIAPQDEVTREALRLSVKRALRHKVAPLTAHRSAGARTVLILESHDLALIGHQHLYRAFLEADGRNAAHLDEVWFCRTYNPHRLDEWYGFHGPQEILDRVNMPNLRLGSANDSYWNNSISTQDTALSR